MTEGEMVAQSAEWVRATWGLRCAREVPYFECAIDLTIELPCGLLYPVEFKLRDWTRVLQQAWIRQALAPHVAVCLPHERIGRAMLAQAAAWRIGVIAWHDGGALDLIELPPSRGITIGPITADEFRRRFEWAIAQGR